MQRETEGFLKKIMDRLEEENRNRSLYPEKGLTGSQASVVLCLLSECLKGEGPEKERCLVFNKRSKWVRQAGDLCFPGGGIAHRLDAWAARLLGLPGFPLGSWSFWKTWRRERPREAGSLSLLLAAGLRECLEEMRLNPFSVRFLGPLPPQALQPVGRCLYPMVVWIKYRPRYRPNREVEKVVSIPLRDLLNPARYVRYRMHFAVYTNGDESVQDFPGFFHSDAEGAEVLWGVTYRIVMDFLGLVFDFTPPAMETLPVVDGERDENYLLSPSRNHNRKD